MKKYIVTAVDHGDTCDGKARVLEVCDTKDEAIAFVHADIEQWADERAGEGIEVDFYKMSARYTDGTDNGCKWNIESRDIVLDLMSKFDFWYWIIALSVIFISITLVYCR